MIPRARATALRICIPASVAHRELPRGIAVGGNASRELHRCRAPPGGGSRSRARSYRIRASERRSERILHLERSGGLARSGRIRGSHRWSAADWRGTLRERSIPPPRSSSSSMYVRSSIRHPLHSCGLRSRSVHLCRDRLRGGSVDSLLDPIGARTLRCTVIR